jgi:arabinofuranosyltransferase
MPSVMISILAHLHRERLLVYSLLLIVHVVLALVYIADQSPGTGAAATGFPLDDAWIHLVYGRAVAQTGLPCYNDGTLEAGFTSPLWMICLALVELIRSLFSLPVVMSVKFLGTLLAWISSLGVYELCRKLTSSFLIALLAAALAAANPVSVFAQISGMEVALTCALLTLTALTFVLQRWRLCAGLLGLSFLSRPEGVLVMILLVAVYWFSTRRTEIRLRTRESLILFIPTIIAAVIWVCYCLAVTGHPLPNTFYAKYTSADALKGFVNIIDGIVMGLPAMFVGIGVVLFLLGAFAMIYRTTKSSLATLMIPWVFLAGIAATRPMPPGCGDFFYWLRYTIPALPFLFVPIAMGALIIANPKSCFVSIKIKPRMGTVLKVVAIILLLACFGGYPSEVGNRKTQFAWNCQNINEVQVEIGKWVKRNTPKDAALLTIDAGAIRYFGERKTIDILGLNNHTLLFNPKLIRHINTQPDTLAEYLRSQDATYYITFPGLFPSLVKNTAFTRLFSPVIEFSSPNYTVATPLQKLMVVYGLNR